MRETLNKLALLAGGFVLCAVCFVAGAATNVRVSIGHVTVQAFAGGDDTAKQLEELAVAAGSYDVPPHKPTR